MLVLLFKNLPILAFLLSTGDQPAPELLPDLESEPIYAPLVYTHSAALHAENYKTRSHKRLGLFSQDIGLGQVDFEGDSSSDVSRHRLGFRAAFGKPAARGYVQVFVENPSGGRFVGDNLWLFGAGVGIHGEPAISTYKDDDVRIVIPFRIGFNVAFGEDDPPEIVEEETLYVEFEGEFGVGAYLWGLRPMIGVYASNLTGYLDIDNGGANPSYDYEAMNISGFAELRYRRDDNPMFVSVRVLRGDVEGVDLTLGASF